MTNFGFQIPRGVCKATPCTHESRRIPYAFPMPFKGTVRTPSVMSGRGYRPQTVHLEPQHHSRLVRRPAGFRLTCGGRKGLQPQLLQPNLVPVLSLHNANDSRCAVWRQCCHGPTQHVPRFVGQGNERVRLLQNIHDIIRHTLPLRRRIASFIDSTGSSLPHEKQNVFELEGRLRPRTSLRYGMIC